MDYIICTRNNKGDGFGKEPGKASYLMVPSEAEDLLQSHKVSFTDFLKSVINTSNEDIVVYVHGYRMTSAVTLERHRILRAGLEKHGFKGDLITFAWPSGDDALLYLEDRHDAKKVAMELVYSGIALLAKQQGKDCTINVHIIAHSTGAYIVQEAFEDAESTKSTAEINWTTSQLIFIAGDVSSSSMEESSGEKVYRHCNRLTNYFSPFDKALAISNVKRVGARNRVGRVGLPKDIPPKAVDVNCGSYYESHGEGIQVINAAHSHSWYFWSDSWLKDVVETLKADVDRRSMATRRINEFNQLELI